jgi:hypothetical protein
VTTINIRECIKVENQTIVIVNDELMVLSESEIDDGIELVLP